MKILFCGKDKFSYHRTRVLIEGLKKIENVSCSTFSISARDASNAQKLKELSIDVDYVIVPAFRHKDVRWVKKNSQAPVVFDPLISEYLTKVIDYGQWYKAATKYLFDRRTLNGADFLLADTEAMKSYYTRNFGFPAQRICVVPVGYISDDFVPKNHPTSDRDFHVGFYGSFVPLQGADVIAKAAFLLKNENLVFDMIGNGATYNNFLKIKEQNKLSNIKLHGWLPYEQLSDTIAEFDICLGIFGRSGKAARVIPNKLFHYGAMQKCMITRDSSAIREIFDPNKNIIVVEPMAEKLAEAILEIKKNQIRKQYIAEAGHQLISTMFNEKIIANRLVDFLRDTKLNSSLRK